MTHALKTWPEFFEQVAKGNKPFELRKDDRPFKEGDTVILQEYDPKEEKYTGKELEFQIDYILRDQPKMGLKLGYCIFGLKEKVD